MENKRRYWYRIYVGECPVCGRPQGYRERVYGLKPTNPELIYIQLPDSQTYDYCLEN